MFLIRNYNNLWLPVLGLCLAHPLGSAAELTSAQGVEFFEKRIRPVLVERCYRCHSSQAEKLKGGLWLDSKDGVLRGGDGGRVLVPGRPEQSRLIEALEYSNPDLQMPPKGKLPQQEIADLTTWVSMGAPWPEESGLAAMAKPQTFDLNARRERHWAWKPISAPEPPPLKNAAWGKNEVDRFILARLESNRLSPAPPAENQTLLRRLFFDLIGLPPTPQEMEDWASDSSSIAYERVVDRLLASTSFGERWARHWLDLVRYAETLGHEFDYPNPNAWRYRDYVIRAFNADVPYNQFLREHVAGDLLDPPRRHPTERFNESIIGTSFYWLGQREHSPVDVRQHQAELIDNQIDVLTKTFLGLTVACARCHDHKFDAIPTQDYYSLYGMLSSSRYSQSTVHPPDLLESATNRLAQIKLEIRQRAGRAWSSEATQVADYLLAAEDLRSHEQESTPDEIDAAARDLNLDPARLERWVSALQDAQAQSEHPLSPWTQRHERVLSSTTAVPAPVRAQARGDDPYEVFADFSLGAAALRGWLFEGEALELAPTGDFMLHGMPVIDDILETPVLHSGLLSRRLQGVVRSPTFTIKHRFIHILSAGRASRINVPVDNFTMIRDPIYGGLKRVLNHDEFKWIRIDVEMWKGHRSYLEFSDLSVPDPADDARRGGFGPNGYIAVREVLFSDEDRPPTRTDSDSEALLGHLPLASRSELANRYQQAIARALHSWMTPARPNLPQAEARLLNWLLKQELLSRNSGHEIRNLLAEYQRIEAGIPDPIRVPALVDGTGLDERVFVRGNPRLPGEVAPRRFLQAIAGPEQPSIREGSGRLELAEQMLDSRNPFVARVIVNRVWGHLFGRGLVPTPDDFGQLGQEPTHPELLDWLANWFRTDAAWSTKRLIRLLVTSSTYRMSSQPAGATAESKDPENLLWHRMPLRRLEGEAIRDSILAVSGRLEPTMFGEPVPIHLTEFMDGRGRPGRSGPLDGAGRRTIYVEVRRNFVSPMMRAFDMPVPFTTIGRRTVSNVPAQSLILMNDPFVLAEAKRWAKQLLARTELSPEQKIQSMYSSLFSRRATSGELAEALAFLELQSTAYGVAARDTLNDPMAWADLAHVLFNVKEFVFLN